MQAAITWTCLGEEVCADEPAGLIVVDVVRKVLCAVRIREVGRERTLPPGEGRGSVGGGWTKTPVAWTHKPCWQLGRGRGQTPLAVRQQDLRLPLEPLRLHDPLPFVSFLPPHTPVLMLQSTLDGIRVGRGRGQVDSGDLGCARPTDDRRQARQFWLRQDRGEAWVLGTLHRREEVHRTAARPQA